MLPPKTDCILYKKYADKKMKNITMRKWTNTVYVYKTVVEPCSVSLLDRACIWINFLQFIATYNIYCFGERNSCLYASIRITKGNFWVQVCVQNTLLWYRETSGPFFEVLLYTYTCIPVISIIYLATDSKCCLQFWSKPKLEY